jgi:hypothetical protein
MQPKGLFPKFWNRQPGAADAPGKAAPKEVSVNPPQVSASGSTGSQIDLLSYEDIYRAAGILSPGSGYGVHKVAEMLNSSRIRELSKDIKRASVLMALDAANTSPDELMRDATRRQQALDSYEAAQQKQLEQFEARKAEEDARIQQEMERVNAHYAERIQLNQDQVAREKAALRNWQMAKQYESQRIAEVIELCGKQPSTPSADALSEAAANPETAETRTAPRTGLHTEASAGR